MSTSSIIHSVEFYDRESIKTQHVVWPDVYFEPEYGYVCEASDHGSTWECCIVYLNTYMRDTLPLYKIIDSNDNNYNNGYNNGDNKPKRNCLIMVYLKIPLTLTDDCEGKMGQWRILTPYGYSGAFWHCYGCWGSVVPEPAINWWPELRRVFVHMGCVGDIIIRQNPYIANGVDWSSIVDQPLDKEGVVVGKIMKKKTLYIMQGTDTIMRDIFKKTRRNYINKAEKEHINKLSINSGNGNIFRRQNQFVNNYKYHMQKKGANEYYLFNNEYYNRLIEYIKTVYRANTSSDNLVLLHHKKSNSIIGGMIILGEPYSNWRHYHLSFSNHEYDYVTTYMLYKYWIDMRLHHRNNGSLVLGCGVEEGDGLAKFKERHSNHSVPYIIYSI